MPRQPVRCAPKGAADARCQIPLQGARRGRRKMRSRPKTARSPKRPFVLEGALFMKRDIRERLKAEVLLTDGAMGTLLVSRGAPAEGPRSPNSVTAPDLVREIHDDYVAAGSQVLSTNTWDANRAKLSRFDWADSLEKINRAAVRLARAAAEGEYVYVAGSVGPLGQLVKPYGPLTRLHVRELFTEQIRILLEEGVDLLSFETFSSTLEAVEALRAARALSAGIPIVASMTFLADGKTSFGEDAEGALAALVAAGADVVGMNCTVGPQEAFENLSRVAGSVSVPISVRPLSLIHISEPTRLGMISYAVFCLK